LLSIWIVLILLLAFIGAMGQSIVKRNNLGQFQTVSSRPDSLNYSPTNEKFVDSKGTIYTVYRTKNGKYFVLRTSKKTGKQYREYLKLIN